MTDIDIHDIDILADGSLSVYRDRHGNPRLRGTPEPYRLARASVDGTGKTYVDIYEPRPSTQHRTRADKALRAKLRGALERAVNAADDVRSSKGYSRWFDQYAAPYSDLSLQARDQLGGCVGDEGYEWFELFDVLTGSVWQPGYRADDV